MDVLHSSLFYTISIHINSLVPPRNNSITPLLVLVWILHSQPLLHVFGNLVITPQTFFQRMTLSEGFKEVEVWGSKRWTVIWASKNNPTEFYDGFPCSSTFVWSCVVLWWISATFLWGQTLLKRFCKVLSVWMYSSELMFWPRGVMSTKNTPYASPSPKETVAMTFPAGVAIGFFWREVLDDTVLLSFCLPFKVMVSFSISDDPWQKAFTTNLVTGEQIWAHLFPHSFVIAGQASWSPSSTQFWICKGVSVVHTSLYTESSFAVFLVVSCQLFRMSSSARLRNAWIASAAVGWPERRASTSSAWLFAETAISEARLTVILTAASTPYKFFLTVCEWALLIPLPWKIQ